MRRRDGGNDPTNMATLRRDLMLPLRDASGAGLNSMSF